LKRLNGFNAFKYILGKSPKPIAGSFTDFGLEGQLDRLACLFL